MNLLETLIVVLFVLWLCGAIWMPMGGLIHILLVLCVIVLAFRLLSGRRIA